MTINPVKQARRRPRTWGEARQLLLRDRGVTLSDIARDVGTDVSVLSRVNQGIRRSRRIEQIIADRLGLTVADAFPERRQTPPTGKKDGRAVRSIKESRPRSPNL